jgi:hypothetical protein
MNYNGNKGTKKENEGNTGNPGMMMRQASSRRLNPSMLRMDGGQRESDGKPLQGNQQNSEALKQ